MGRWPVTANGESEPVFIAESFGGAVRLHMPSSDPVLCTVDEAERIRQVIGSAIAAAQTEGSAHA